MTLRSVYRSLAHGRPLQATVLAAALTAAGLIGTNCLDAPAATAEPVYVAPGSGIKVLPEKPQTIVRLDGKDYHLSPRFSAWSCSQGPSGTVRTRTGEIIPVMVTAGHCIDDFTGAEKASPEIFVDTPDKGFQRIGLRDKVGRPNDDAPIEWLVDDMLNSFDWGTVRLDKGVTASRAASSRDEFGKRQSTPVVMTGIKDYPTLVPGQIVLDNFGQPICKDGARTGRSCGTQVARTRNGIWSYGLDYLEGDSGGNNYDPRTREVIGVTSMGLGPLGRTQPADIAIETAYGIPSGQVNQHFQLAESTAVAAPQKTFPQEGAEFNAELEAQGLKVPEIPNFRAEFNAEAARAQGTAAKAAADLQHAASAGDFDAAGKTWEGAAAAGAKHVDALGVLGIAAALQEHGQF